MRSNTRYWLRGVAIVVAMLGLVACSKRYPSDMAGAQDLSGYGSQVDDRSSFAGSDTDGNPLEKRVFYFDFDSSEVKPAYVAILRAHAQNVARNPSMHLRVEGHTDERGSREYNVALGERRAKSVARLLEADGVNGRQLSIVSYGAEKPATRGHDESAWQYNRRVEIVYETR